MRGLREAGDFGSGGRDVPLGPAAVDPDVRAADSGASGFSGREEIAEAEPQAVDFSVGGAEDGNLQRVILVGNAAGDEFQPGAAIATEGNEAGTACVERLAGFKSRGRSDHVRLGFGDRAVSRSRDGKTAARNETLWRRARAERR